MYLQVNIANRKLHKFVQTSAHGFNSVSYQLHLSSAEDNLTLLAYILNLPLRMTERTPDVSTICEVLRESMEDDAGDLALY